MWVMMDGYGVQGEGLAHRYQLFRLIKNIFRGIEKLVV